MDKIELESYRRLNDSFQKRLICRIGIDCGFFVELNYMVNAILYCLAHRIRFQLYSDNANFGTGKGWTEYFLPFCEEVHDTFHQRYNIHRRPSWTRILRLCQKQKSPGPIAWKIKGTVKTLIGRLVAFRTYGELVSFEQDVVLDDVHRLCVPELGIDADYMEAYSMVARMVWRLRPEIMQQQEAFKQMLGIPLHYSGVHIRGGDKVTETSLIGAKDIIQKLGSLDDGTCLFVLTDDYRIFARACNDFPKLRLLTLCKEDQTGYSHKQFCDGDLAGKKDAICRLLISVNLLISSTSYVGSITTGPSVFVLKMRFGDMRVQAVDCPEEELPLALRQTIDVRSRISQKYLREL